MGRYADELKKMTRAQGGGPAEEPPPGSVKGEPRRHGPWVAVGIVLLLAGGGWLLMRQMMADSKLQDCVMSGRKNCAPIDTANP